MVWRYFRLTRFVISASRDFEVCYAFVDDDAVDAKPVSQQIRSGSLRGWFMTSIQPCTTRTCSEIFCCELEVCGTVFHSRQIWAFPFLAVSFRSQFAPRVAKVSRWIDRSRSSSCTFATKFNEGAKIFQDSSGQLGGENIAGSAKPWWCLHSWHSYYLILCGRPWTHTVVHVWPNLFAGAREWKKTLEEARVQWTAAEIIQVLRPAGKLPVVPHKAVAEVSRIGNL